MTNIYRNIVFFFCLLLFSVNLYGQDENYSTSISLGLTAPILDSGIGFHVGVNPRYSLGTYFSIEAQASFIHTKISSSFISGREYRYNSFNLLTGGRVYFGDDDRAQRLSANVLLGYNFLDEFQETRTKDWNSSVGYSLGLFIEGTKANFGVSYDSPKNLILRVGFLL